MVYLDLLKVVGKTYSPKGGLRVIYYGKIREKKP